MLALQVPLEPMEQEAQEPTLQEPLELPKKKWKQSTDLQVSVSPSTKQLKPTSHVIRMKN